MQMNRKDEMIWQVVWSQNAGSSQLDESIVIQSSHQLQTRDGHIIEASDIKGAGGTVSLPAQPGKAMSGALVLDISNKSGGFTTSNLI
jgi:hypothetical protein